MSEICEFYRDDGVCADVDGDERCEFAERWEDCCWYMPKDPWEEETGVEPEEGEGEAPGGEEMAAHTHGEGKLEVVYLPIGLIDHHPDNPRKNVGDVMELAESIRAEGIQQPLTVIDHVDGVPGRYTAVIGHRRLEAAKAACLAEVPVFVRQMDRREQLRTMMTENTQREDLTPLEEADGFQQLMLELPEQTAAAVARETGFSETTVRRRMKLLELPRDLMQQAEARNVTLGELEQVNQIKDPKRRDEVLKAAGTDDFRQVVKDAKDQEEKLRHRDRLVRELRSLGAKEITAAEFTERNDLESQAYIYAYRWKEGEWAHGWLVAGHVYVFYVTDEYIRVLRVRKGTPKTGSDEATKARERESRRLHAVEEMDELRAQMEQMVADFRMSREDFVGSYDKWERNREEIMAFAVRLMLTCVEVNVQELAKWLDIGTVNDKGIARLEEKGLRVMLNNCPEKALLYTAYWCCEGKNRSYTELDGMDYELNTKKIYHNRDGRTDRLYEALAELGYLMSEDERKWQRGDLPQYTRAKQIAIQWKK